MTQQRRFTKEFEDEAVRLVRASGRSQREIAEDLGIGLSTLIRWLSRSRNRQIDEPDRSRQEDVAAELKRLRRENEILRQERTIREPSWGERMMWGLKAPLLAIDRELVRREAMHPVR